MKLFLIAGAMCAAFVVSGCATRASGVAPVSVSSNDYAKLSCDRQREELASARIKEEALRKKQNNAALLDAAGVFIALVPVGSLFGSDVEGELAQAKGETLALERSIKSNCGG